MLARTLLEDHVLLFRGESGQVVALHDRCPHRGALLSKGRREGDSVRCMYHGIRYDATGRCTQIPGQDMIPPKLRVRSYPVVERNHLVWIWMGDPARADEAQIVDFPYLSDPQWKGIPDYIHYDANYLLIMDNLSDFGHLAFVHTKTLGGSEEYAFVTKPVAIERLPRGFRVERWHMNSEPPPFHRKVIPNKTDKVDRRNIANMHVPAIARSWPTRPARSTGATSRTGTSRPSSTWRRCSRRRVRAPRKATSRVRGSTAIASS